MGYRIEKDSMGEFRVPEDALYGAQTARAVENFPVSGAGIGREMIKALGLIKYAAAEVNRELGKLAPEISDAIQRAAQEVIDGKLDAHFPVDVFQTGSGTSSNMNANEVIANRAIQLLGGRIGSKTPVHPNDHVNMGQSSNDVFPSAIHVAALIMIEQRLLPSLTRLQAELENKAIQFDAIVKTGRTHLQDATPIRLGQEFSGYASQVAHGIAHIKDAVPHLSELAIGGTAVGTGINTHPEFGRRMAQKLSALAGVSFIEAGNHFEAQAARDAAVQMSGALKTVAASLIKIANDLRFLGSGPRLGLGELIIPPVQPGSSIMPGKVNPVIAESLIMAAAQAIANDAAITLAGLYGNFELNVMLPLIAKNLLEQISLLANASRNFADKLVAGLQADRARIADLNEKSLALATALAPVIGYDRAAEIAKQAYAAGKTVREVARDKKILPDDELDAILDLKKQTEPGE
ncbi:MAG TPA: class II fumarate hydratase [bacterium]|nr:class II fumarate hydratase [bacterium]